MANVITCADTFNNSIIAYCRKSNITLKEFLAKIPIDAKYNELYDSAVKARVINKLTGASEYYIFLGKKAIISGYYLVDVKKIQ